MIGMYLRTCVEALTRHHERLLKIDEALIVLLLSFVLPMCLVTTTASFKGLL